MAYLSCPISSPRRHAESSRKSRSPRRRAAPNQTAVAKVVNVLLGRVVRTVWITLLTRPRLLEHEEFASECLSVATNLSNAGRDS